ncbi:MAG: flavin reductase family protein [Dictyoglomus turgidum]
MYHEVKSNFVYLIHPLPGILITSIGKNNNPNVMSASWITPISINPPLISISLRPERYTYELIKETGDFAINIPDYSLRKAVFICGRYSGRKINKFKKSNLTPIPAKKIRSPIVKECLAHIECTLERIIDLPADHHIIIGRVQYAQAHEEFFKNTYIPEKFKPLLYFGKDIYGTIDTYEHIKPEEF